MPLRWTGLWRQPDFLKLWFGQAVSEFGSVVTRDALPLAAVLVLRATPAQMGVLAALVTLPALLIGLPAGAWTDRLRRRPIMITSDLARAAILVSIPIAWLLGALHIEHLYLVAVLVGAFDVLFDVAYQSYLPTLVEREHVLEGNAKLGTTEAIAEIGGSALAGVLVQGLNAPITILIDAISFLVSASSVGSIRRPEPQPIPEARPSLPREIAQGLRLLAGQPLLRALTGATCTLTFFGNFYAALYAVYAIRVLGFGPATLGLLIACGGVGALVGSLLARRAVTRLGLGPALIGSMVSIGLIGLGTPLAAVFPPAAFLLMLIPQLCGDAFRTVFLINSLSLRQAITPDRVLGRVNATMNFAVGGVATAGVLTGGFLAGATSVHTAVWVAALGSMIASTWLFFSPLRSLRDMPPEDSLRERLELNAGVGEGSRRLA